MEKAFVLVEVIMVFMALTVTSGSSSSPGHSVRRGPLGIRLNWKKHIKCINASRRKPQGFITEILEAKDCHSCVYQDFEEVQRECRDALVKFEKAISEEHNNTAICISLVHMYYCVGEQVPQCIRNFTTLYQAYHQSPHDCHITMEETTKLQQYIRNINCNTSGGFSSLPSQTTAEMTSEIPKISTSTSSTASMRSTNSASRLQTGGSLYVTTLTLLVTVWTLFVSVLT